MKKNLHLLIFVFLLTVAFFLVRHNALATITNDTLVGYWKLDKTSTGSTVTNSAGIGNNENPKNSSIPNKSVPYTTFLDARSLSFNGSNKYVSVPNYLSLNFRGSFTIAFWMKPTTWDNSSSAGIISKKYDSGTVHPGYVIYDDGYSSCLTPSTACQPFIKLRVMGTNGKNYYLYSASAITIGQ